MSSVPTPQMPPYRITLFYGPEAFEGSNGRLHCVFNVKKRSWKAGVQVVVELDKIQLAQARHALGLESWEKHVLAALPEVERRDAESRIPDLLAQIVCAIKLDLAIEEGIPQENLTVNSERLDITLDRTVINERPRILEYIRTELDLPEA